MKKFVLTVLIAAFAITAYAGETKKCDPANCKDKACSMKANKKACKDGKACKDKKACEGMKKAETTEAAPAAKA